QGTAGTPNKGTSMTNSPTTDSSSSTTTSSNMPTPNFMFPTNLQDTSTANFPELIRQLTQVYMTSPNMQALNFMFPANPHNASTVNYAELIRQLTQLYMISPNMQASTSVFTANAQNTSTVNHTEFIRQLTQLYMPSPNMPASNFMLPTNPQNTLMANCPELIRRLMQLYMTSPQLVASCQQMPHVSHPAGSPNPFLTPSLGATQTLADILLSKNTMKNEGEEEKDNIDESKDEEKEYKEKGKHNYDIDKNGYNIDEDIVHIYNIDESEYDEVEIELPKKRKDIKHTNYPEFKLTDKDKNDPMGFYAEYESGIITSNKKDILAGNKLKVANIYREFLQLDARIHPQTDPNIYLIAPFYDPNSGVKKIKYYESIKNYLNEQNTTKIFDPSKINGAIDFNLNQEEQTESNKMKFLKPIHIDDDNLANDINLQMTNFNELMRTCYHAINYNVHTFSQSEILR
ncbi:15770_t:CDS:2, partial [Dentiscutata erythropus]